MENLILRLGRPGRIQRPTKHALAWPRSGSRLSSATDAWVPHDRETDRGGKRTAAWLVAGDSSGEAIGANVFTSPVRT